MSWTPSQTLSAPKPWYVRRLFVKQDKPVAISLGRGAIRTLEWRAPAKVRLTACMLCATRPVGEIGNQTMLRKLGLHAMADAANAKLRAIMEGVP